MHLADEMVLRRSTIAHIRKSNLRPTTALVRKAIFDSLGSLVVDAYLVDLFSGTGRLGIEALTRGARKVIFVEKSAKYVYLLRRRLKELGFEQRSEIYNYDVIKWLKDHTGVVRNVDIIIADPPYESGVHLSLLSTLGSIPLKNGCIVVIEHSSKYSLDMSYSGLQCYKVGKYGDTSVTFYKVQDGIKGSSVSGQF
jgi:16S rRNA (guanine966-N2)-methyltransferase